MAHHQKSMVPQLTPSLTAMLAGAVNNVIDPMSDWEKMAHAADALQ
jgi:hypothetical protein